jgi:hypothetical protein
LNLGEGQDSHRQAALQKAGFTESTSSGIQSFKLLSGIIESPVALLDRLWSSRPGLHEFDKATFSVPTKPTEPVDRPVRGGFGSSVSTQNRLFSVLRSDFPLKLHANEGANPCRNLIKIGRQKPLPIEPKVIKYY